MFVIALRAEDVAKSWKWAFGNLQQQRERKHTVAIARVSLGPRWGTQMDPVIRNTIGQKRWKQIFILYQIAFVDKNALQILQRTSPSLAVSFPPLHFVQSRRKLHLSSAQKLSKGKAAEGKWRSLCKQLIRKQWGIPFLSHRFYTDFLQIAGRRRPNVAIWLSLSDSYKTLK